MVVLAVKYGKWSDPATWDTGKLPEKGDVVKPNGYTVVIDQDIEVDSLDNSGTGGNFICFTTAFLNARIIFDKSTCVIARGKKGDVLTIKELPIRQDGTVGRIESKRKAKK